MIIAFDVDYTILGVDGALRSNTLEAFKSLSQNHEIVLWSTWGARTEVVEFYELGNYIHHVCGKNECPVTPDIVVDDYPEMATKFGGIWVPPFFNASMDDDMMRTVCNIVSDLEIHGTSSDTHYSMKGSDVPERDVQDAEIICGPLVDKLAAVRYLWSYHADKRGVIEILEAPLTAKDNIILEERPDLLMSH